MNGGKQFKMRRVSKLFLSTLRRGVRVNMEEVATRTSHCLLSSKLNRTDREDRTRLYTGRVSLSFLNAKLLNFHGNFFLMSFEFEFHSSRYTLAHSHTDWRIFDLEFIQIAL